MEYKAVATCAFGVEAMLKRELIELRLSIDGASNGRVYFRSDYAGVMRANLWLRSAEHVYLVLGEETIKSFDELFDWIKTLDIEPFVKREDAFIINAQSQKSALFSLRDIQKITKKSLIENLKTAFDVSVFNETNKHHDFLVYLMEDKAEFLLDTSGAPLHKRGYREQNVAAPIKETLAAAIILQSFYSKERILIDPFCGSGTIPIEAAMIGKNIAPGLNRSFAFERFKNHDSPVYKRIRKDALLAIDHETELKIFASDVDHAAITAAQDNAFTAGVDDQIHFKTSDIRHITTDLPYAVYITNPPYGRRLEDEQKLEPLYRYLGQVLKKEKNASFYILSAFMGFEKTIGKRADKTRVLFNGNIKSRLYQYFGPKPQ